MQGVFYLNQAMPFGGVKASGHGRFGTPHIIPMSLHTNETGGEEGLRSLCTPKSIIHDRLFSLIRTPIPKVVGESPILFLYM
jgi:acyl-CoA reductase-like NAD-dependent aldehyde dehydrogenase